MRTMKSSDEVAVVLTGQQLDSLIQVTRDGRVLHPADALLILQRLKQAMDDHEKKIITFSGRILHLHQDLHK